MRPVLAVIDPNVVVSALIKGASNPGAVLAAVNAESLVPVVSPILLAEIDRTTSRVKFRKYFTLAEAWAARWLLETAGRWHPDPPAEPGPLGRDPADDYLLRLYHVSSADWIISGDADVHQYGTRPGVVVFSPREAVGELARRRATGDL